MNKSSLNQVILVGRVGHDPELKYTKSGAAVCNLSMVTNEVYKDKNKDTKENSEWHNIVIWGESGERSADWISKGQMICITGKLKTESWENDQGEKRYKTVIVAESWTTLSKGKDKEEAPKKNDDGDDLPF